MIELIVINIVIILHKYVGRSMERIIIFCKFLTTAMEILSSCTAIVFVLFNCAYIETIICTTLKITDQNVCPIQAG